MMPSPGRHAIMNKSLLILVLVALLYGFVVADVSTEAELIHALGGVMDEIYIRDDILLSNGAITIQRSVTLRGLGVTIDGDLRGRVIEVGASRLTLIGVSLANGRASDHGGCALVNSSGELKMLGGRLTNCRVEVDSGCSGGRHTFFRGGALASFGTVELFDVAFEHSWISGQLGNVNQCGLRGGGMFAERSSMLLVNVTFYNTSVVAEPQGISQCGRTIGVAGGGLAVGLAVDATLENVTFDHTRALGSACTHTVAGGGLSIHTDSSSSLRGYNVRRLDPLRQPCYTRTILQTYPRHFHSQHLACCTSDPASPLPLLSPGPALPRTAILPSDEGRQPLSPPRRWHRSGRRPCH